MGIALGFLPPFGIFTGRANLASLAIALLSSVGFVVLLIAAMWDRANGRHRIRQRRAAGQCIHCGYYLTGLPAGGACPECGKKEVGGPRPDRGTLRQ